MRTALSIRCANSSMPNVYRIIIATDRIVASGFARFFPAISGAEPCIGSYRPLFSAFSDADGSIPIDPVNIDASSDRMSPNMFPVRITSNCFGARTSCIAALSTYMCDSSTSRYSLPTSITTSRHTILVSSTFALSTEQSFRPRFLAIPNATCAMRLISDSLYFIVSKPSRSPSSVLRCPRGCPKYISPVNSRRIIRSRSLTRSGFNDEA